MQCLVDGQIDGGQWADSVFTESSLKDPRTNQNNGPWQSQWTLTDSFCANVRSAKACFCSYGFTNVHHISCWLINVAWQTFLSIMSMSTNSMFPGYPTRNSQSHKVSAFFNQHHWPPVCSSLSHSCCFFCCSAFGLSTVVPLDVPLGPFADGPSHWSPAFRHCSSHVLMAMPLRDRHARRSVVTLRLKLCKKVNMFSVHPYLGNDPIWLHPDFWKPLENLKRWSETLVVVIRVRAKFAWDSWDVHRQLAETTITKFVPQLIWTEVVHCIPKKFPIYCGYIIKIKGCKCIQWILMISYKSCILWQTTLLPTLGHDWKIQESSPKITWYEGEVYIHACDMRLFLVP